MIVVTLVRRRECACIEPVFLKAGCVAQLTVRKVPAQVVDALKKRAAARGRSAEAEHRDILHAALFDNAGAFWGAFAERAGSMRQRLRASVDSTETIRAARDRDCAT